MPSNNDDSSYIRVILLRRGQTSNLYATEESVLDVNNTFIEIPPNSFYTADGQLYQVSTFMSMLVRNHF